LITRKVYHDYFVKNQEPLSQLSEARFKELVEYVNTLSERLHSSISGNHFLFVGRYGAQKIADYVEHFDKEIEKIEQELKTFLR